MRPTVKGRGLYYDKLVNGKLTQTPVDKHFYIAYHHGLVNLPYKCSVVMHVIVKAVDP